MNCWRSDGAVMAVLHYFTFFLVKLFFNWVPSFYLLFQSVESIANNNRGWCQLWPLASIEKGMSMYVPAQLTIVWSVICKIIQWAKVNSICHICQYSFMLHPKMFVLCLNLSTTWAIVYFRCLLSLMLRANSCVTCGIWYVVCSVLYQKCTVGLKLCIIQWATISSHVHQKSKETSWNHRERE